MRKLITILFVLFTTQSFAKLVSGVYVGNIKDSSKKCSAEFKIGEDADYAKVGRSTYRITVHTKGFFIDCTDSYGVEYNSCASGDHTGGNEDLGLYMVGLGNGSIEKLYIQKANKDIECVNLELRD